ncbi:MAG TPA: sensor domain-containing diguanylate cyclase [Acidimicrobiales bacterium]|nr:sensor domain-containing diguanylate cyclase [Acidimicrobiales bacterium]
MTVGTSGGPGLGAARQDVSGALTSVVVRYVRGRVGDEGVARMLELGGETRPAAVLEDPTSWSSHDEAVALLDAAAVVTGDPDIGRHVGEEMLRQHDGTEVADLLRSLGSPGELLRNVAAAAAKFSTVSTVEPLEVGDAHAVVRAITRPGFARHPQICAFTKGLLSQVPALFGLVPAVVGESECQARGGRFCLYSVAWEAGQWSSFVDGRTSLYTAAWSDRTVVEARSQIELDEHERIAALEGQVRQLTKRLEGVYSTAADLLAAEDIEGVLARITARAAHAVNAPRYLLVVQTSSDATYQLHHHGFSEDEANLLAHELLADRPDDLGGSRLIVDIASSRRHYGRLAAVYPEGMRFFTQEQQILAVYGDYAATALDVVTALDEARRSNATASALLDFSRALSGADTVDEVVATLLATVPTVAGCERATVMLWDPDTETLTVRHPAPGWAPVVPDDAGATAPDDTPGAGPAGGAGAGAGAADETLTIHRSATPLVERLLHRREIVIVDRATDDPFVQSVLAGSDTATAVIAPLFSGDEFLGFVAADFEHRMDDMLRTDRGLHERLRGLADHAVTALQNARLLEQIRHMAWHDALTGLPNRRLLADRARQALLRATRTGESVCIFFVDLDRLKHVNDALGHASGDELIQQAGRRLCETVRRQDTVARLGGDEFAVLLPDVGDLEAVSELAGRALHALGQPYVVSGRDVHTTASIGIALAPLHGGTYDELLSSADAAMYQSKGTGGNNFRVFMAEPPGPRPDDARQEAGTRPGPAPA